MQNRVQKMLKRFFADKLKRRRLTAVVSALSVLVVVGVFLQLMQPVITMTPDPVCGKEAHAHGDACYEQLLTCTSAEEGHVHGEACYANTLTCGKEAHEHVDACYPETVEEPTVPPTEEPTAVVTEAPAATSEPEESETPSETDGSAGISAQTEEGDGEVQPTEEAAGEVTAEPTEEATGEATAEPTEEATGEATAEPTEEATGEATAEPTEEATGEATAEPTEEVTGEATAEPTVETTGEATAEPTVEATAEPTEEPTAEPTEEVVVPLTLDGLTVDMAVAKVGEAITWQFNAAGAEKVEYVIVDEAGSVMAGSELTANYISWTASHAGKYTIIVTAYAGEEVASVSGEVTAQDTAELTASVWSDALYCFAGQDVTFNLAKSGETEITACEITVVQNGKVLDSRTEFAETVTVTTEAQSNVTDVTLTLTLTDAAGAVVTAAHTIPCPVKVVETEAEWKQAADIGELSGVWADDLLAIAKKQIGYFESDVNFIINEEGRHGYTRYGDWYGQPYREWCAMFLSYCLEYAEVPEEYIPRHASSSDWMDELRYLDLFSYRTDEDCEPAAGDLIFFDWDEDGVPEHIGMVSEVTETLVYTIEGNAEAAVRAREYAKGDKQILGYGLITKAYEQYVEDITPDEDMTSVSGRTGVITASKANLRAAADASSERIDTLTEGAAVSILSAEQNEDGFWWYQLAAGELTGYVRSDLVALDEVVPTAEPTAEPTPEPTPEPTAEPTPAPTEEPVDPNTLYGSLMLQIRALTAPEQPAADADEETLAAYQAAQAQYEASRAALNERILTSYASTDLTDEEYRKLDAALTGAPEPTAEPTPEATFAPTLEPTAEPTPTPAPNPVQVSMEIEVVDEEAETANIIMTAALTGISAEDYLWQWQVSATGEEPWENIEGATELTLTIPLSEESYNAFYRIYGDYIEPAEAAEPQVTAEPTAPAEQAAAYGMRTMSLSMDEQPSAGEDAAAAETAGIAPAEETSGAQTFAITTGGDVASDANTPAVMSAIPGNSDVKIDIIFAAVDANDNIIEITGTIAEYDLNESSNSWLNVQNTIFNSYRQTYAAGGTYKAAYFGDETNHKETVANYIRYNSPNEDLRPYEFYCRATNGGTAKKISNTNASYFANYAIYIYYTPAQVAIAFDTNADGTAENSNTYAYGYVLTENDIPNAAAAPTGQIFAGWLSSVDNQVYTRDQLVGSTATANVTYTAQFRQPIVSFVDPNGVEETASYGVEVGKTLTDANVQEIAWTRDDGYMLAGWYIGEDRTKYYSWDEIADAAITDDVTYTAAWVDAYTVTFNLNGQEGNSEPIAPIKVQPENKAGELPSAVWFGSAGSEEQLVFAGWYTDADCTVGNEFTAETVVNEDIEVFAKWVKASDGDAYYVYFCNFGSTAENPDYVRTYTVAKDQEIAPYQISAPAGYRWDGNWYVDAACTTEFDFDTLVSDSEYLGAHGEHGDRDLVLYPKMEVAYKVNFVTQGTRIPSRLVGVGESVDLSAIENPTRDGYIFQGWYVIEDGEEKEVSGSVAITQDTTFYARWEADYVQIKAILRTENADDTNFVATKLLGTWWAKAGTTIKVKTSGTTHTVVSVDANGNEYPVYTSTTNGAQSETLATLSDAYESYFVFNNLAANGGNGDWEEFISTTRAPYSTDVIRAAGDSIINFDYMRVRMDVTFNISNGSSGGHIDFYTLANLGNVEGAAKVYYGTFDENGTPASSGNHSASGTTNSGIKWTYTAASNNSGTNKYVLKDVKYEQDISDAYPVGTSWLTPNGNNHYKYWAVSGNHQADNTRLSSKLRNLSKAYTKGDDARNMGAATFTAQFENETLKLLMYAFECLPGDTTYDFSYTGPENGQSVTRYYKVDTAYSEAIYYTTNTWGSKDIAGFTGVATDAQAFSISSGNNTITFTQDSDNSGATYVSGGRSSDTSTTVTAYRLFGVTYWDTYKNLIPGDNPTLSAANRAFLFAYNRNPVTVTFDFGYGGLKQEYTLKYGQNIEEYQEAKEDFERHQYLDQYDGYEFRGWMDADGNLYSEEDWEDMVLSGNTIFFARWEKKTRYIIEYYVSYEDIVQGSEPFQWNYFEDGDYPPKMEVAYEPDRWEWTDYDDGATKTFDPNETIYHNSGVQEDRTINGVTDTYYVIKVYGVWSSDTATVVYDANVSEGGIAANAPKDSGTYIQYQNEVYVQPLTSTENTQGKTFVGWKLDKNGRVYQPGEHVTAEWLPVMTFEAQWADDVVYLIYDPNQGTPTNRYPNDTGYAYARNAEANVWDNTTGENSTRYYTRDGYEFVGWNTAADGSGTAYDPNDSIRLTEDKTILYAQWRAVTYDLSIKKVGEFASMNQTGHILLEGAQFRLEEQNSSGEWSEVETGTSDATGMVNIEGLEANVLYRLSEIKAPNGYYPVTDYLYFKVNDSRELTICKADGGAGNAPDKVSAEMAANKQTLMVEVVNTPGSELPSTGGAGTLPYTLGGLLMMAVSLVYGLGLKRRRERGTAR